MNKFEKKIVKVSFWPIYGPFESRAKYKRQRRSLIFPTSQ